MSVAEFRTPKPLAQDSAPAPCRAPIWPMAVILTGLGLTAVWTILLAYGIATLFQAVI